MIKPVARPEQLPSLDIRVLDPSSAPRGSALQPTAYVADSLIVFARDPAAAQAVIARLVGPGVRVSVAPLFRADLKPLSETAVLALHKVTLTYEAVRPTTRGRRSG